MKEKIIKGVIEFFLIVFSVLLAFYLEDIRQSANEKNELVSKLREFRNSLTIDSTEFVTKLKFLAQVNDSVQLELKRIVKKENVQATLTGFHNTRYYFPLRNWALEKIAEDGLFNKLNGNSKGAIYQYSFDRNFPFEAIENHIYENDKRFEDFVYENLKYKFSLTPSGELDRVVRDSSVLYSDELKSYLIKKGENIYILRSLMQNLLQATHETAVQIDKELKERSSN